MYQKYGKRLMDMLFSVIALIILSVPMLIIAVAIKLTSPGPVFFRHQRYGKDKKAIHYQQIPHDVGKSSKKHAD